jgi:hypothetical protein
MTLRDIYFKARDQFVSGSSLRCPIYLSLREHIAQTEPDEALYRHAEKIGFPEPHRLISAWRAGFVALFLDGFDELTPPQFASSVSNLRQARRFAVEIVRRFIEQPPKRHRLLFMLHYTGARREEICGLSVHDVACVDAVIDGKTERLHYITIRTSDIRRIKNLYSERSVVLHPELIRLGFLDYVAAVRALGYEMVFPDLKSPTSSSPLGDRLYDELIDGLRQAIPDAIARKKVIHSMRKSFGNTLKQEGIHSEIRGDIMGHSGATPSEEIYCDAIALAKMLPSIMKIPIVTAHLQPHPIRLLPWVQDKLPPPFSRNRREANSTGAGCRPARKTKGE